MPYAPFALSADRRARFGMAPVRLCNWLAQPLPVEVNKPVRACLLPTPGRTSRLDMGAEIQGVYQENGVRSSSLFVVAGGTLYSVSSSWVKTSIGAIGGTGLAIFAGLRDKLFISQSGLLFVWDGATLTQVTDVDLPLVESMLVLAQRVVVSEPDADTITWSSTLDGTSIDALAFATAEQKPDVIRALVKVSGQFIAMGATSLEIFRATGSTSLPFANVTAQSIDESAGLLCKTAYTVIGDKVYFLGGNRRLYVMNGFALQEAPTNGELEDELQAMSEADRMLTTIWGYTRGTSEFVVVRPKGKPAFVYDASTRLWHTRETWEEGVFTTRFHANAYGYNVVADEGGSVLYTMDENVYTDAGTTIERVATFRIMAKDYDSIGTLCLDLQAFGRPASGQGSAPRLMVDISTNGRTDRDDNRSEIMLDIGPDGTFRKPVLYGLGMIPPGEGMTITLRLTDPIGLALYGAWINEGERA